MTRANSKNSPVRVPASPARRPACETSWQGQPAQMRSTAGRGLACHQSMVVRTSSWRATSGKWRVRVERRTGSISTWPAQRMPSRARARSKPPMPANSDRNVIGGGPLQGERGVIRRTPPGSRCRTRRHRLRRRHSGRGRPVSRGRREGCRKALPRRACLWIAAGWPWRIARSKATASAHSLGDRSRSSRHWRSEWYGHVICESPVTARVRLGEVTAVTADGDVVWAAHGCAIARVDAHTGRVAATVGLPPVRGGCFVVGMAVGGGALWVSLSGERLLRVDPHRSRVVATLAMADPVGSPAVKGGGVWGVCCWSGVNTRHPAGWLVRVDPARNRVVVRVRLPGLPTAVGVGPSGVWVTGAGGPIWRVDPASGRVVATIRVPGGLGGLPGREGPAGQAGDELVEPDEFLDEQGQLAEISDLAASPGAVWVAAPAGLFRVDLARLR